MRYAIFSDVHANRQAWEAVRDDALRQGVDTLICLGDVVGYGPKPLEVLRLVREATPNFVLGNHDAAACGRLDASIFNDRARAVIEWTRERLDAEALAFLNQVPLQMDGPGILLVHAEVVTPGEFGYVNGPDPARLNLAAMTQPLAFIGHTHLPLAYTMPGNGGAVTQLAPVDFKVDRRSRTIVNVGSVGEPRTTDVRGSYVIYDDASRIVSFRKVAFDIDGYRRDLEEVGLDIRPYFLEVVDSGRAADAPSPVAGPQLAMADLPKVAEGVSGAQSQLVLGRTGKPIAPVQQPRTLSGGVIAAFIVLIVVIVSGLVVITNRKSPEGPPAVAQTPAVEPEKDADAPPEPTPDPPSPKPTAKQTEALPKPKPTPPKPEPTTTPAARLSEDLLAYWSLDRHDDASRNRIDQHNNGSLRETLVAAQDQPVEVLSPKSDIGTGWRQRDFDATDWKSGQNGVGYEEVAADYQNLIKTKVGGALKKRPHSVYVRIPFKVDDPAAYVGLALTMRYDDGFAAFLNGEPMAGMNAPEPLRWNSASTTTHGDEDAVKPELFKVSANLIDLEEGWNLLAIHGMNGGGKPNATNNACPSSDLLVMPTLVALRKGKELPKEPEPTPPSQRDSPVTPDQIQGTVPSVVGRFGDAGAFPKGIIKAGTPADHAIGDQSFSVSAWFSRNPRTNDKSQRYLLSAGTSDAHPPGWSLALGPSASTLVFSVSNGKSHATVSAKVKDLANGKWHHAAATVDRPSGMVQVYLDGKRVAHQRVDFVGSGSITSKEPLAIGGNVKDRQHHRGRLDEIALWRRTLVPDEITQIFQSKNSLGTIFDGE